MKQPLTLPRRRGSSTLATSAAAQAGRTMCGPAEVRSILGFRGSLLHGVSIIACAFPGNETLPRSPPPIGNSGRRRAISLKRSTRKSPAIHKLRGRPITPSIGKGTSRREAATSAYDQACVKTPMANFRVELPSRILRRCSSSFAGGVTFGRRQLRKRISTASFARARFHTASTPRLCGKLRQ